MGGATAEPNIPNSKLATDFTTNFNVMLQLNGTLVTTGSVQIRSKSGMVDLTFNAQEMRWQGAAANYDEVYELNVTSGPDKISAVYVDGPDIHVFTLPTLGATLDPSVINDTKWTRAAAAQLATFRAGDGDGIAISDTGDYMIPALKLQYEKDQTKNNTLRLTRTNQIAPKGAVAGSTFSVGVAQELDVIASACPTCP